MVLRLNTPIKQEKAEEEEEAEESEKGRQSKIAEKPQKPVPPKLDPKHEIKCAYFNRRWDEETSGHLGS